MMFGMNAEDALGAMEDIAIFHNIRNATQDQFETRESEKDAEVFNRAAVALRERANTIARLKGELDDVQHNRNVAAVSAIVTSEMLAHVIRDFARAVGVSESEMRKRYNVIRTQHFNRQVNEGIEKGWFQRDPRLDLSEGQKNWFVPGMDSDHGF